MSHAFHQTEVDTSISRLAMQKGHCLSSDLSFTGHVKNQACTGCGQRELRMRRARAFAIAENVATARRPTYN